MENEVLIRQCLEGKPADAQQTFNGLLLARISNQYDQRRQEIGHTLYAHQEAE